MARKAHRHLASIDQRSEADADASFAVEVAASLRLPGVIGNVYTARCTSRSPRSSTPKRRSSRASALACSATVRAAAPSTSRPRRRGRRRVSRDGWSWRRRSPPPALQHREYEAIRAADATADQRPVEPVDSGRVAFLGVDGDRRVYSP